MFETATGSPLITWRAAAWPPTNPVNPITLHRIADHRHDYLEFEGPLSNDRGHVRRIEGGSFELLSHYEDVFIAGFTGFSRTLIFRKNPHSDNWICARSP
jgi:hypothetical protein